MCCGIAELVATFSINLLCQKLRHLGSRGFSAVEFLPLPQVRPTQLVWIVAAADGEGSRGQIWCTSQPKAKPPITDASLN